jgi:hypothetical protein
VPCFAGGFKIPVASKKWGLLHLSLWIVFAVYRGAACRPIDAPPVQFQPDPARRFEPFVAAARGRACRRDREAARTSRPAPAFRALARRRRRSRAGPRRAARRGGPFYLVARRRAPEPKSRHASPRPFALGEPHSFQARRGRHGRRQRVFTSFPFSSRCGYEPPVRNSSTMYLSYCGVGSKYPGTRRCSLQTASFNSTPIPGVFGTAM